MLAFAEESYLAVSSYTPGNPDEVSLHLGQLVKVREKALDGWWKVTYANREGFAPAAYLARADSRKVGFSTASIVNE